MQYNTCTVRACGGALAETTEASFSADIIDVNKIIYIDEIIHLDDE